MFTLYQK